MTAFEAAERLRRDGYTVVQAADGAWLCRQPWRTGWMPPVDNRQLVNRAKTAPVLADLYAIRRRYGP
jgi:hypothetical protein